VQQHGVIRERFQDKAFQSDRKKTGLAFCGCTLRRRGRPDVGTGSAAGTNTVLEYLGVSSGEQRSLLEVGPHNFRH
jgi:hypothetical protein